ncbi:hypothetical protein VTL71DRAFT_7660 [Oculimacula yallundae]|uniref:Uncharacterized protein n=1 Tax=Oculimacula yallundae TaxID=86028 RepID=A0ABR4BUQ9_9HELO
MRGLQERVRLRYKTSGACERSVPWHGESDWIMFLKTRERSFFRAQAYIPCVGSKFMCQKSSIRDRLSNKGLESILNLQNRVLKPIQYKFQLPKSN